MQTKGLLYEGKAKKVYEIDREDAYLVDYKDDATAFNGLKKGSIIGKGAVNNRMSNHMFKMLEGQGIPTHYIEEIDDRRTVVKKVEIVPVEVIMRNIAAGSLAKKLGLEEGLELKHPVLEFCYKNDDLGDPMINESHAVAIGISTYEELAEISEWARKINSIMVEYFKSVNIILVDFKLEFGRCGGKIILADEISPDTCRLWDADTREKLDKDRFRRDMGGVEDAYQEVYRRIGLEK